MMAQLRAVTDTPPKAIVYLRQSTYREESISLELQELACRDYCDRHGYAVVAVESDPGISGRTWNRKGVQNAMAALEAHTADVVVLWKWSRLSRSRKDWALAIDRADLAGGKIESATEPIDTATASGRFARGVMTEYAAFQSEQIGEQWEEVRQRRLKMGLPASGRIPFGWQWAEGGIAPHADHAPLVVEMYRRYLSGDGGAAIAQWLNAQRIPAPNGGLWSRARPLGVMDSPVHVGLIPYRGSTHDGEHEPIIDKATWDAYQAMRTTRRETKQKPRTYAHLLSNLMHCSCGARMYGKGSITGGKLYRGYLCSETMNGHEGRAYVSALTVEPLIIDWFMTFDAEVEARTDQSAAPAKVDGIRREINALEVEMVNLTRQHTRGIIPEAAYVRTAEELDGEIRRRKVDERRHAVSTIAVVSPEDLATLRATWVTMTMAEKSRSLRQIIKEIHIQDAGYRIVTVWGSSSIVSA